jgi:hypothetical protein
LLDRLLQRYPNPHHASALLRSLAKLPGEIRAGRVGLSITIDALDNPLHPPALRGLCAELSLLKFRDT